MSVHVYNMAQAPSSTVDRAKKEAGRILAEAGLRLDWVDCPLTSSDMDRVPECRQLRPTNLTLRIIPQAAASLKKEMIGFALPDPGGAIHATVFYGRAEEFAEAFSVSTALVLGHAIAHEIGHLLLGSEKHSSSGLMKAQWRKSDLRVQLRFSSKQAESMKEEVARRMERAAPLSAGRR